MGGQNFDEFLASVPPQPAIREVEHENQPNEGFKVVNDPG